MGAPINVKKLLTLILVLIPSLCWGFGVAVVSGGSDSPWLTGYDQRIKITIDKDQIDTANQTNFPVMVYLSAASGIGDVDVSAVFDELTSDANRKKIAVTSDDETTELYVEIERWDDANEKAWLHVKVPSVANDADTVLYLYYDKDHADNTTYIGDTTDAVTHNVWDSNFKAVYHMGQDPNGDVADAIKDSTSNANDGTPGGSMTTVDLVDGKVGKGIDFDGGDDLIEMADDPSFNIVTDLTAEFIVNPANIVGSQFFVSKYATDKREWSALIAGGEYQVQFGDPSDGSFEGRQKSDNSSLFSASSIQHGAFTFNDGTVKLYYGGTETASSLDAGAIPSTLNNEDAPVRLANGGTGQDYPFEGIIDEARISSTARSAAWIKATYHSLWDSLVTFGAEETP